MADYTYYRVKSGSPLHKKIKAFFALRGEQIKARDKLLKDSGAKSYCSDERCVEGFRFKDGKKPDGWVNSAVKGYCKPGKKSAGKDADLRKRMDSSVCVGVRNFTHTVMGCDLIMDGMTICCMLPAVFGRVTVLAVPLVAVGKEFKPEEHEVTEMLATEFRALEEKQKEAGRKKKTA